MFLKLPTVQGLGLFLHLHNEHVFKNYNELLFDGYEQPSFPTGTYFPFSKKNFVTANGKLLPCERIGQHFTLGKVDDNKVEIQLGKMSKHIYLKSPFTYLTDATRTV